MDVAELKKLLAKSKSEPVNCAIGLDKDGDAAILLHKSKTGSALLADLKKEHSGLKGGVFGSAMVDTEVDVKLVVLTLNHPVKGLSRSLRKALKGTGYSKVEIRNEDGSVAEAEGEDAEAGAAADQASPAPQAEAAAPPAEDLKPIEAELRALAEKLPAAIAADPQRRGALLTLASAGSAAIKSGDAAAAHKAVAELTVALAAKPAKVAAPAGQATVFGPGEFVAMQKSRLIWDGTQKRVKSEIAQFRKAVLDKVGGDPQEVMVIDALDQLNEVLATFNEEIRDKLDELLNETDPAEYARGRTEVKKMLANAAAFADSNKLVKKLDGDTPFGVKLSIGTSVSAALKGLQASIS